MRKTILFFSVVVFCFVSALSSFSQEQRDERDIFTRDILTKAWVEEKFSREEEWEARRKLSDVVFPDYRVRPHTILHISLRGEGRLEAPGLTLRVSTNGIIKYPYIGEVDVLGLTEDEMSRKLEGLLEKDYVRAPQVTVMIKASPKYFMLGDVNGPGRYGMVLDREITLTEGIALAGGLRKRTGLFREEWAKVRVIRTEENERVEYFFYLGQLDEAFLVRPDDIIIVEYGKMEERGSYYILGEVSQEGRYPIVDKEFSAKKIQRYDILHESYITILGAADVVDAILVAKGFTDDAARNYVRVRRKVKGKWKVIRIPVAHIYYTGDMRKNLKLKDGDVISVPESWF
jgi:protein involved in polysaccharide export with SLBB domain